MSETVRYEGKLKLVTMALDLSLEERCKLLLEEHYPDHNIEYFNNYIDCFKYTMDREYHIDGENIYEIYSKKCNAEDDIFEGEKIGNDIKFHVMYYNGGCSFDEALDEVMKKVKNDE